MVSHIFTDQDDAMDPRRAPVRVAVAPTDDYSISTGNPAMDAALAKERAAAALAAR
jgi:hypothetical protein